MRALAIVGHKGKVATLGAGVAIGVASGKVADRLLPSTEAEARLEARGISTISHREATARVAPMAFVAAAAIGAGIGRRSEAAALTTASLGAATMLASTAASTVINADNPSAYEYLTTLGLMTGVAGAGFALGAIDEVPINFAKLTGLGLLGIAVGMIVPEMSELGGGLPADLRRSYQHRNA